MNRPAIATLQSVTKVYQAEGLPVMAIEGASFSVGQGEICAIIGASGSGKTTLLNIIGGIDRCNSGTVVVDGRDITLLNDKELTEYRRREVGYVFQFYNLIPNLTALENVELASDIFKTPIKAADMLDAVGLGERRGNFPSQLSGGEQQRVAIARALVKMPKLLLCDEPTGALDSKTGVQVLRMLQQASLSFGVTVILVTHNTAIVEMANRIITVRNNRIERIIINPQPYRAEDIVL
ncbi:MAG: ABC transporter ATP-binding protein [Coriobacteriales bacterium]|jgi:putative ABC transport system ATP-binding protein|nr:ABC transporter ATP-binding protein [Coriobacteriales bacterium]